MSENLYLKLYTNLVKLYKNNEKFGITVQSNKGKKFFYSCYQKIDDIELQDDYIDIILDDGDMSIYETDGISYYTRKDRIYKNRFLIESEDYQIIIDASSDN